MADSKAVEGVVDDLLLGDGFSVVDSTKGDGGEAVEAKPEAPQQPEKEQEKEEVQPEVTPEEEKIEETVPQKEPSPVKDDPKVNGHDTKSDALLITTEEDLELTVEKLDKLDDSEKKIEPIVETTEVATSKIKKEVDKDKPDKRKTNDLWVSNITRHVKATDLKKHFSKHGKVLTAKIVTNGKSFFGYILMETGDIANKCVKALHNTVLDGHKISVSRQRPDQRKTTIERRVPTVKPSTKVVVKPEKTPEPKEEDPLEVVKRSEARLKRETEFLRRELTRAKRSLWEEEKKVRAEQQKGRNLYRQVLESEGKLKEERRRFERDREVFEKNARTDRMKVETDRTLIKKELDEVKKLREYLKRKIEEDARAVERRPRAASPYAYSAKRFRESGEKMGGNKYVEERTRTPPSPPKLSRPKRSPVGNFEKERRGGPSHHYGMNERNDVGRHGGHGHGNSLLPLPKPAAPAAPRNLWTSAFHQEVWRVPPGGASATSTPFASGGQSSFPRQSDYSSGGSKGSNYSQQRDFGKRDHYSGSSSRKY